VGGLSRGDGASTAVVRRNVVRLQLQLRLGGGRRCVGGRHWPDGSLRNNHGTCLSNEYSDNADDPSKVVMPPMTSHAWRQSVCFRLTRAVSTAHRLRNIDGKCRTAALIAIEEEFSIFRPKF